MLAEGEQNNGTTNAVRSIRLLRAFRVMRLFGRYRVRACACVCVRVRALSVQLRVWYGHTTYLFL
jgi:hypothetical protein